MGTKSGITEEASCKGERGEDHGYDCKALHDDVHDISLQAHAEERSVAWDGASHLFRHAEIDHGKAAVLQRFQLQFPIIKTQCVRTQWTR